MLMDMKKVLNYIMFLLNEKKEVLVSSPSRRDRDDVSIRRRVKRDEKKVNRM